MDCVASQLSQLLAQNSQYALKRLAKYHQMLARLK